MADSKEGETYGLPPTKKARACITEEQIKELSSEEKSNNFFDLHGNVLSKLDNELPISAKTASLEDQKVPNDYEFEEDRIVFSEKDFGIENYISVHRGINGIIKQRYSDFIVREIDQNGKIIKLCSTAPLEEVQSTDLKSGHESERIDCPLTEDDLEKIQILCSKFENEITTENSSVLLKVDNDKEHRKLVHLFIKENYKNLDTETVKGQNEDKMVKVFCRKSEKSKRCRRQHKDQKRFCNFTLYKENRDTMSAINLISRLLHVKPSVFSYAGTKDKRAITSQRVCASNIDAGRVCTLNKVMKNIAVGDFEYAKCALKLGDLGGNHFSIVLRNISPNADESSVSALIQSLKQNGFINYFGMQRFGSGSVPTFEIGKQVLSSQWEDVIKLILCPRSGEEDAIFKAKEHWLKNKDSKAAHEIIQKRRCIEEQVLHVLASQGERSYYNAFQSLSRNMRLMYVHSYQSFIWNRIASKRLQIYGIHPIVGDLVIDKSATIEEPGINFDSMTRCKVKALTEEDIANSTYAITDIVLPLPGYDVTYPSNPVNNWYSEMLSSDGLDKDNMHHQIKDYSLSGAYRYMIVKPDRVNFKIVEYDDYCIPLLLSDMDLMNGKELQESSSGKFKALILEFSLPPSSYATMLIREITKLDTSTHTNIGLNTTS